MSELHVLKALNEDQVHFVALLARAARMQRDSILAKVREASLVELLPARGERNPTAALGFDPVAREAPQITALRDALAELSPDGRSELYALMRIGQGQLGAGQLHRGITDAARLGDDTVTAAIIDDPDLHDHLKKGLYEATRAA